MTQLKVFSTIETAGQIYRDRFSEYYRLAFTNSFWLFVPIYGWAKYAAIFFYGSVFIPAFHTIIAASIWFISHNFIGSLFTAEANIIFFILNITLFRFLHIAFGALFIPFWQSIKAVTYSQLNRDE